MKRLLRTFSLMIAIAVFATACGTDADVVDAGAGAGEASAASTPEALATADPTTSSTATSSTTTSPTTTVPPATTVAPETTAPLNCSSHSDGTCVTGSVDATPADVARAEAQWAESGITAYTYTFVRMCASCRENTRGLQVTVVDGEITEVTSRGNPVDDDPGATAEDLFAMTHEVFEHEGNVNFIYDANTGFPLRAMLFDQETGRRDVVEQFGVSKFTVLGTQDAPCVGGCSPSALLQLQLDELAAAEALWAASGITSYTYSYSQSCECPDEYRGSHLVTVVDGEVTEVTKDGEPSPVSGNTAEDFFEAAREVLLVGDEVEIQYNPETGFMDEAVLDVWAVAVDGGWQYGTSNFTVQG